MKFSCKIENLKKGLQLVSHVIGKNQSLPILNNVLLETEEGVLNLSTTNLEIGIKTSVRGKVDQQGSITIPARLLTEYINNLNTENIDLEVDKTNLKIFSKGSNTTIKGLDASEFPLLPDIEPTTRFNLNLKILKKSLSQTVLASATDSSRPELCSILMRLNNKQIILTATDSYRLAEKKISLDQDLNIALLIPQTTLQEVNRVFDGSDENIKIELTDNQIKFSSENCFLISRVAEGQFPDYEQIIPNNNKTQCIVNTNNFIKAIRASSIFCRQGINDLKLELRDNKIILKAVNDKIGESFIEIEADLIGEDNNIVFNYHYLLDVLGVVDTPEIDFGISEGNLPGVIRPHGDINYTYVIMPIRQ